MSDPDPDFLDAFPQAAADTFKVILPGLMTAEGMVGRFDLNRLKGESVRTPAVLVSIVRLRQGDSHAGPHHHFTLEMAAFILTRDRGGVRRDEAAAAIAQALTAYIPDKRFGFAHCGQASKVSAEPVVSSGFLSSKVSMWAVTWQQPCVLAGIPAGDVVPLSIYLGKDLDTGLGNEGDYNLVAGEGQP